MKNKKIILYHPATEHEKFYSFYWIPYSLLSIASMVHNNYEVIIIDDNLKDKNNIVIDNKLLKNCLCVGISMMTGHQILGGLKFAQKIKTIDSLIPIIVGGSHATLFPEMTTSNKYFDFVIQGQGEIPFLKLVNHLNKKIYKLNEIEGLVYIKNNKIIKNQNKLVSKKEFPDYPWELINLKNYINNDPKIANKTINYISSQGCPFKCTFCSETSLYKNKWKSYGEKRIIKDISYLIENVDINAIKFYDANFFVNLNIVNAFMNYIIDNNLSIKWAASGHPKILSSLKDDIWKKLTKSNCKRLLIGAESGSQKVLNSIRKNIKVDDIVNLAYKIKKFNIIGSFTFIVGFPNMNTDDEISKTLEIAKKIRSINKLNDVKIHFFSPYPGTELFDVAIQYGFNPPKTLIEWANYDYYNVQMPWLDKKYEKIIHKFNKENCEYVHL